MRAAWRASYGIPERETPCWRARNDDGDVPKFYVYDVIGGWDLDAGEFVRAVHTTDATAIDLHINSPGGFVYDAVAMFEALAGHQATVNVHIDGLAASAASFLAMAGDTIDAARAARMMIHDAQMLAWGSPAELREAADLGDEVSNDIAGFYAGRAGGDVAEWRARMQATTWYSAEQAKDAGLVDSVRPAVSRETSTDAADNRTRLIMARAAVTLGRGAR